MFNVFQIVEFRIFYFINFTNPTEGNWNWWLSFYNYFPLVIVSLNTNDLFFFLFSNSQIIIFFFGNDEVFEKLVYSPIRRKEVNFKNILLIQRTLTIISYVFFDRFGVIFHTIYFIRYEMAILKYIIFEFTYQLEKSCFHRMLSICSSTYSYSFWLHFHWKRSRDIWKCF